MNLADLVPDLAREVVQQPNGEARQAGATQSDGAQVRAWRVRAERSLFFFSTGILGYDFLSPTLHRPICEWITHVPPYRKMLIVPRGHGKTTIVGQSVPMHMWIQPAETNLYYPGQLGTSTRVLLVGEKEERASDHLRVIQSHLENNAVLRALWPHIVWENARRQSGKWNDTELILPREKEWPDPSLRACGVGAATTGMHPNAIIKDDLTTEKAANEPSTMALAIRWHTASRALFASPATDIELITGTRWAPNDLPGHVMENDPTVEVNAPWRSITEGGAPIWPEHPTYGAPGAIARLMAEFGVMFPLLYMNSIVDSGLVDFSAADLRRFEMHGDQLAFSEDDRDIDLAAMMNAPLKTDAPSLRGHRLDDTVTQEALRNRFLRRQRSM